MWVAPLGLWWQGYTVQRIQDCFICADRDLFVDTSSDELTEAAYRNVCEDLIIPRKFVHVFP